MELWQRGSVYLEMKMERVKRKEKITNERPVSDRHECWPKILGLTAQLNITQRKRTRWREGPEIKETRGETPWGTLPEADGN